MPHFSGQDWFNIAAVLIVAFIVYEAYDWFRKRSKPEAKQVPQAVAPEPRPQAVVPPPAEPPAPRPAYVPPPAPPPPPAKTDADWRAELAAATTPEECLEVYNGVPQGSPIEVEAGAKMVSLLTESLGKLEDIDDCWKFREEILDDLNLDWDETSQLIKQALEKALGFVTTYDEVRDLFTNLEEAGEGADLIEQAAKKMLDLATFDECFNAIDTLSNYSGHDDEEDAAFRKALSLASDADECQRIRDELSLSDEEEDEVVEKQIGFTDSIDDCQSLWDDAGIDTAIGRAAILRAAELIKAEDAEEPQEEDGQGI